MNTGHASSSLEQLLAASSEVDPVDSDILIAARSTILAEAHATTARAARIVRLRRRHRRLTTGIAAAAAAGVVAVTLVSASHDGNLGTPTADPSRHLQGPNEHAPVERNFTTVAQVVNAAVLASSSVDPSASPYWKVVTSWDCTGVPDADGVPRPSGAACQNTMWTGNGRPGVLEDVNGGTIQMPQGTVDIDGQTLTWKRANSQAWTEAEVATMVADNAALGKDDRAPSGYYAFKNVIGLLTYSPASTAIREQLWRQLAEVPGVTFHGPDTDALGRTGWRLTWTSRAWGSESIIIDTTTGMPLEHSDQAPGVKTANVTTIVSVGPAADAPAAPSAKELRREKLAQARACGVIPGSTTPHAFQLRSGRAPQLTNKQQSCLDSAGQTPAR